MTFVSLEDKYVATTAPTASSAIMNPVIPCQPIEWKTKPFTVRWAPVL